jgi:hypothetical protein
LLPPAVFLPPPVEPPAVLLPPPVEPPAVALVSRSASNSM